MTRRWMHSWPVRRAAIPGTSMAFEGIQDAALRQTIIDYLKALQ